MDPPTENVPWPNLIEQCCSTSTLSSRSLGLSVATIQQTGPADSTPSCLVRHSQSCISIFAVIQVRSTRSQGIKVLLSICLSASHSSTSLPYSVATPTSQLRSHDILPFFFASQVWWRMELTMSNYSGERCRFGCVSVDWSSLPSSRGV